MRKCVFITLASLLIITFITTIVVSNISIFRTYCCNCFPNLLDNIIIDGNFKEGLSYWNHDKSVEMVKVNGENCILINGEEKKQVRIWQNINVVSGETYKLSFTLDGKQKGAFAIYRDSKTGKEEYIFCKQKDNAINSYTWEIKPKRSGTNQIYLSTKGIGEFKYSKVSLIIQKKKTYLFIKFFLFFSIIPLFFLFLTIVKYNSFFITIVLLLFIIPIFKANKNDKSEAENRKLASYKPVFIDSKINKNYGIDFNNWLNDRFWIRNVVLQNYNSLNWFINRRIDNKFVVSGKDKWLFLKSNIMRISRPLNFYEKNYKKTLNNIQRLNKFCKDRNTKLYMLIAPYGEELYSSKLIGVNIGNKIGALETFINKLSKDTGVDILYCYNQLNDIKSEGFVYYKTDHHWTPLGAYNAYIFLMNVISKKYNVGLLTKDNFIIDEKRETFGFGETFKRINNVSKGTCRSIYPINDKYMRFQFIENYDTNMFSKQTLNDVNKERIFIFGDSFVNKIKVFFEYSFKNTRSYVKPLQINMPEVEKMITQYNPDIVIMIVYSRNYELIQNWYK